GGARLREIGPSVWQTGLAVGAEVALGALLVVLVRTRRGRPDEG
ncbi:MAG: hypothetical protein JWO60_326, partial [Frankiales bacterium]|nr:hypothetical protein [Frankiales bacterium]